MANTFVANRSRLASWVRRVLRNSADVEDVVQETFVRSYQQIIENEVDNPKAYMFKTARNLAFKHNNLAVNRLSDALDELELDEVVQLEDPVMQATAAKEEMSWLCEAIRELPLQCRRVFVQKKIYGLSHREISQRLGLSENTVHQHLAKGVARCALYMSKRGYSRGDINKLVTRVLEKEHG